MSKRTRQEIRTAAKYIFLEAAGIALFKIASAYAYTQRGYIAVGGEYILLMMPLFYKMAADMVKDMVQTLGEIAEDWKEERCRRARAVQQTAEGRSNEQ